MAGIIRDDIDRFFEWDVHVPSRRLFMGGEVDETMAERFIKGITLLQDSNEDAIRVIMDNIGGDEYHGMGIYDAIACCPCHVTITVFGHAMSMGSWILQAADKRVMAPHATLMMHYGSWELDDHVKYVRVANKEMERVNLLMEEAYMHRMKEKVPGIRLQELRRLLLDETFMPADKAVSWGLADRVLT